MPLADEAIVLFNSGPLLDQVVLYDDTVSPPASGDTHVSLDIDAIGGGTIILRQTHTTLPVDDLRIGISGIGAYEQLGGTNAVTNDMVLGVQSTSIGYYDLIGGILSVRSALVGNEGAGVFTQSGGTHAVTDTLTLGNAPNGNGTYDLIEGRLTAAEVVVGGSGYGAFTQSGGTQTVTGTNSLVLAKAEEGVGVFALDSGSLQAPLVLVGVAGEGVFTQTGGTHTATSLILAQNLYSNGTYILSGGILETDFETVADQGIGFFIQYGGTHTVTYDLRMGAQANGVGSYTLNDGILSVGDAFIGDERAGFFTQFGGTHTLTNNLILGNAVTGSGTYNLIEGRLTAAEVVVGGSGYGTFNQGGGTHTATSLILAQTPGSSGTYTLEGGVLDAKNIQVKIGGAFHVKEVDTTLTAEVVNAGTVKTTNTAIEWGAFTNQGRYESESSTQAFTDLFVDPSGVLVAASQDTFLIKGDFENRSTQNTLWDTAAARLEFDDGKCILYDLLPWPRHIFHIPGTDLGPSLDGFEDNFAWGAVDFNKQSVKLLDGSGHDGGALYVEEIAGLLLWGDETILNIRGSFLTELNIYYDATKNPDLEGLTYSFLWGKGHLIPINHTPLPGSVLLLGTGLLGLGLAGWRRRTQG
ncbi:MAG: hypothetical protein P8X58_01350 [Syntrophobacterales bacterium]